MKRIYLVGINAKGKYALVDDEDYERISKYRWYMKSNGEYAQRVHKRRIIRMHREIMCASSGQFVDHINRKSLDNRKSNLRFCTQSQNSMNRGLDRRNTSGLRGVSYSKIFKKWRADIGVKRRQMTIGYFKSKEDAARAYNQKAKELHGEFAQLNKI